MKLPKSITSSKTSTVLLPLFFFARKKLLKYCGSLSNCMLMYDAYRFLIVRGLDMMPQNKSDLVTCLDNKLCMMRKKWLRTHVWMGWGIDLQIYVLPDWFNMDPQSTVSQLSCFVLDFQEPYWLSVVMMFSYVLLPYSSGTPLFDERFVDYGYNKVQLIEHLRAANFKFYILNHAFAMDLPHPEYFIVFFFYVALHSERSMLEGLLLCYVLIGSSREN